MSTKEFDIYIKAACNNDSEAFETLYRLTYKRIYFLTLNMTGSAEDAQDAMQETYIKAFSHLNELKNPSAFSKWLLKIAVNTCKNFIHKNKLKIVDLEEDELAEQLIAEESYINDDTLEKKELRSVIMNIINSLPSEQKRAILLYYYEQLTVAQIAELEVCTVSTITSRLSYARAVIKKGIVGYEERRHTRLHTEPFLPSIGVTLAAAATLSVSSVTATIIFIAVMNTLGIAKAVDGPVLITPLDDHIDKYNRHNLLYNIKRFWKSQLVFRANIPVIISLVIIATTVIVISVVLNPNTPASVPIKSDKNNIKSSDNTAIYPMTQKYENSNSVTVSDFAGLQSAVENGGVIVIDGEIAVTDTLTVTSDVTISGGTLYRAGEKPSTFFRDDMIYVSGSETGRVSLTLDSVTIDGRCYDAASDSYKRAASLLIAADGFADIILKNAHLLNNDRSLTDEDSNIGSAVNANNNSTILITGDTVIENNRSQGDAGAVGVMNDSTLTMNSGIIRNNITYNHGGGILAVYAKVYQNGGEIYGNYAESCGGGIIVIESELYITGGSCYDNNAQQNGGGVYIMSSSANISGYTCTENYAVNDGGIYIYESDVIFENCTVTDNITERTGGGIAAFYSSIEASGMIINGNKSVTGGGLFLKNTSAVFESGDVSDNNGSGSGGGIYTESGELTLRDVKVNGNKSELTGGGIYLFYKTNLNIKDGEIKNNKAINGGDDLFGSDSYDKHVHFITD